MMGRWNRFMLARRPEPLIYDAWIWELQRGLLADRLGAELFYDMAAPNVPLLLRILRDRPEWCDDPRTPAKRDLRRRRSPPRSTARSTGSPAARAATSTAGNGAASISPPHRHPLFDAVPLLRDVASVRFPSDGGANTLNRAKPCYRGPQPFEAVHGAGYRGVYDFSDLDNSRFAIPLGQSGNMLSRWSTQLRRELEGAALCRDRRHARRAGAQRRRHDHPRAARALTRNFIAHGVVKQGRITPSDTSPEPSCYRGVTPECLRIWRTLWSYRGLSPASVMRCMTRRKP